MTEYASQGCISNIQAEKNGTMSSPVRGIVIALDEAEAFLGPALLTLANGRYQGI